MEILGLTRNVVGAVGNQISVTAGYSNNNHLNGLGNLLSEISAVGITTLPSFSLLAAKINERLAHQAISRYLPRADPQWRLDIGADIVNLKNSADSNKDNLIAKRLKILSIEEQLIYPQQELAEREVLGSRRIIKQQLFRNSLYGPTKMANDLLGIIVGYDGHLDSLRMNQLSAAGNLTYTIGQGFNFCKLWQEQIGAEKQNYDQNKQRKIEQQMLQTRLALLESLKTTADP